MSKRANKISLQCFSADNQLVKEYGQYGEVKKSLRGCSETTLRRRANDGKEYLGFVWKESVIPVPQAPGSGDAPSNTVVETLTDKEGKRVEIEIRLSDCYVNATKVCQSYGKRWNDFWGLPTTKELVEDMELITRLSGNILVETQTGRFGGTYIHPDLAIELLRWCNRYFRVEANSLIRRYLTGQVTTEESRSAAAAFAEHVRVEADAPPVQLTSIEQHRILCCEATKYCSDQVQQLLVACGLDKKKSAKVYPIANNMINQVVYGLGDATTNQFLKSMKVPENLNLRDMGDETSQLRMAKTLLDFQLLLEASREKLKSMGTDEICDWIRGEAKARLQRTANLLGSVAGMRDHILQVDDAKKLKADIKHKRPLLLNSSAPLANAIAQRKRRQKPSTVNVNINTMNVHNY